MLCGEPDHVSKEIERGFSEDTDWVQIATLSKIYQVLGLISEKFQKYPSYVYFIFAAK